MTRTPPAAVALTVALAVGVAFGACGAGNGDSDGDGPAAPTPPSEPGGPPAPSGDVPELLDLEAPAVDGGTVAFADFAGDQLAVWFWAPW